MSSTEKPALPYTDLLDFIESFFEDKILNCEVCKLDHEYLLCGDLTIFCHDGKRDTMEV